MGKKVIQQLKTNWKGEAVLATISYALKERPHFAAEKFDPDIVHSMTGMMGPQILKETIHTFGERMAGRIADTPTQTYCFAHKDDPTQKCSG